MTTPMEGTTDPALPVPPVDPAAAPAPQPGAAEAPQPAPAPPESDDVDDIELREAKAAAKAEEAAAQPPQPAAVEGQTAPPAAAAPAPAAAPVAAAEPAPAEPAAHEPQQPAAPAARPPMPMVPKARFDEVNSRATAAEAARQKAEQDAAYWRGRAEAQQGAASAPGQPPAQPAPQTPEQRVAAIRESKLALAKRFDDGEMTMADYERQRDGLDDQLHAIREESMMGKVAPQQSQAPAGGSDALYLETLTAQLEDKHPWVKVFDQVGTDRDWAFLDGEARANLTERGVALDRGTLSSYHLREEMARLADEYGPGLLTKRAAEKGVTLPASPAAPAPPAPPPTTPPAAPPSGQRTLSTIAAQRAEKLGLAAQAPPRLDALHGVTGETGGISESQLDAMSDDDIGNLPDAVRRKHRGIL
ncbi:MAG: hypothetical protein IT537_03215 [Hyphomicrobiales bacterium]|nr:hypothetical protein [Hyphomicrobiales bacterium]